MNNNHKTMNRRSYRASAILAISSLLLFSCSNDDVTPVIPDESSEGYHFTFDGGVDVETESRASWNDDGKEDNLTFQWNYTAESTDGDEMVMAFVKPDDNSLLADTESKYHTFVNIRKHSTKPDDRHWAEFETVATYSNDLKSGAYNGYSIIAVTPLNNKEGLTLASAEKSLSATLPMPNTFTQEESLKPEFLRDYMYMWANGTIQNGSASLEFMHIPATLRFIITNERPTEATFKSIEVSLADESPIASKSATLSKTETQALQLTYSDVDAYTEVTTNINEAVSTNGTYTAYALVLPLSSNDAFKNKTLNFSINAGNPDNQHLSFSLPGETLASVNPYKEHNWVGGHSYTIYMYLDDTLHFGKISATPWSKEEGGALETM